MTAEPRSDTSPASGPAGLPYFTRPVPRDLPPNRRRPANPWVGTGAPRAGGSPDEAAVAQPPARLGQPAGGPAAGGARDRVVPVPVDWSLVDVLRKQVSAAQAEKFPAGTDPLVREEQGLDTITRLVNRASADRRNSNQEPFTLAEREALTEAVFNAQFRMGRLQPLLDDDQVENIEIYGHRDVQLQLADGTWVAGDPVAESDQELISLVQDIASRSQSGARPFSERSPYVDMRLPHSGARLAASAWVTDRPVVVIRRHRLVQVTLDDLVSLDMLSPVAASFLAAAVRARKSIVVSGAPSAGKTTLMRALCDQIPDSERIATFETEYELGLQDLRPNVIAWEARPGSGEVGLDGRPAGESTIDEALWRSFRYNRSRLIVGEVRGAEAEPMVKAMQSGTGSLSTTHATSAIDTIGKLVTCMMESGPQVTPELATFKLARAIDLIVYIDLSYEHHGSDTHGGSDQGDGSDEQGGRTPRRQVAEIISVAPGERETGYAATQIFAPGATGAAVARTMPGPEYQRLEAYGFDLAGFADQLNHPASAHPSTQVRS